jgi:hypothetical protein
MRQLSDYFPSIHGHLEDDTRLSASVLIKVSECFRDPELLALLPERVLPEPRAQALAQGNLLRIWSANCTKLPAQSSGGSSPLYDCEPIELIRYRFEHRIHGAKIGLSNEFIVLDSLCGWLHLFDIRRYTLNEPA